MTDFFEVARSQRACRDFAETPVSDEIMAELLDAATHAPSAENCQPWVFVVVRDAVIRHALHDLTEQAWDRGGREFSVSRLPARLLADVEHGIAGGGYRAAPIVVVVAADTTRAHPAAIPASIFPAVQNLLLAAQARGLGSALTTLTTTLASELTRLLTLPDGVVAQAVVPLGHPAKRLGRPRREPFTEHTYRDRYGNAW